LPIVVVRAAASGHKLWAVLVAVVLTVPLAALSGGWLRAAAQEETAAQVRDFELTAAPVKWEIQPGLVVDGWGYNGQVPGPELRVREGDTMRVRLRNRLPVPTTIHWHGVDVPMAQDGVPVISQPAVPPGGDFVYEFTATNPGTRWYHSHVDSNAQLELGLYGSLIVEPRVPDPVQYDREFTYLLDEKALDFTPEVALGNARLRNADAGNGRGGAVQYDLFLINGKAGDAIPPLTIAPGQHIRLRLTNAGNLPHAMHLHGHSFTIVATDGNPVPEGGRWVKDTVLIGPGERYDLEISGTNPGVWMFHCHMPNHQDNGMMTAMVYDGFSLPRAHDHPDGGAGGPPLLGGNAPTPPPGAAAPVPTQAGTGATATNAIRAVDNRFDPAVASVPIGAKVTWTNNGTNLHNVTSFDGSSFDSGVLPGGGSFNFTFTKPGTFRYFCRQHFLTGMFGSVTVV
jgi:FtsP/CotA-like multicopper oxidase with cupredoxin domain